MKKSNNSKRPVGGKLVKWPTIDGASAFSALTHAPESLVKFLRANGCQAFISGNRIDSLKLIQACFDKIKEGGEMPVGILTPQDWKALEQARREAIKRKHDEKLFMLTSDAQFQAAQAMAITFAELERRDRELPPAVAGLPADEVGERMTQDTEAIRKTLTKKFIGIGK